ncbi:MAG: hypothetical protein CMJ49_01320 [Planctomycetaceae bacterium]|nr:hypothetical protein [Planctomycetaceae bacterium]
MRLISALILLLILATARHAPAQPPVTNAQIQQTIQRAIRYLYDQQNIYGDWEPDVPPHRQVAGVTALVTFALITAGESYQSPDLDEAVAYLKKKQIRGTYAVGIRNHIWAQLPDDFAPRLRADTKSLVDGQGPRGTYTYDLGSDGDNSCTQYGVLGAWEGAKRGAPVPNGYWNKVERHFLGTQEDDGGWGYTDHDRATASMTAAGLTCLYITRDFLHRRRYVKPGFIENQPLQHQIDRGLSFLSRHFQPNPDMYYMYGVERVALAGGHKYLNGRDWYAAAAAHMVHTQTQDGRIGDGLGGPVVHTAFALAFLVRGGHPIFINVLQLPDYPWRNRPHAVANLTRWVSNQVERRMLWQVVPIHTPPEDWLDAPILSVAGHQPLQFDPRTIAMPESLDTAVRARLTDITGAPDPPPDADLPLDDVLAAQIKRYIDLGGLLFTHADAGSVVFSQSVHALLKRMYPLYSLKRLAPDDPIYNIVHEIDAEHVPLFGLHNGVRYLVIHSPTDLSAEFQVDAVREASRWRAMANLYYYATENGQLRARLDQHYESRQPDIEAGSHIAVARARYAGNWDPEPAAWSRQAVFMHNRSRTSITVDTLALDRLDQLNPAAVPFVHVTGTAAIDFTDAQVRAIRQYVNRGGVMLFDAAGGRAAFTESVAAMLQTRAFDGARLRPIDPGHPVLTGRGVIGGFDCTQVDYRRHALLRMGKTTQSRLLALQVQGEPRLWVSYEDLTAAWLDQPMSGVFGYSAASARRLAANLVLWSAQGRPGPPAQPPITNP